MNARNILARVIAILVALPIVASAAVINYPHWPGVAVVKFDPSTLPILDGTVGERTGYPEVDRFFDEIGVTRIEVKFVGALPPVKGGVDIRNFYNVWFPEALEVGSVIEDMKKLPGVLLAEPWQIDYLTLDHNDPQRGNQYGLNLSEANAAHDISTGDRGTPVGIVDTGVSLNHEDLAGNLWVNPGEDLNGDGAISQNEQNGEDDDRNGYIDDFYGWDFVARDNSPNDQDAHGSHCAGIASAVTNNRRGISSLGYSCSIMAVRSGSGQVVQYGYEGITYAVRNGAKVISCSWGGYGRNEWTDQTIMAALQNDVLVICAAGNDNVDDLHYPSAYAQVVAVAATDRDDDKAGFSNYGEWVDISAPGVNILSTVPGGYAYFDGTSMACPFAAGLAVLIRAAFPEISALETRDLLLRGADDIYDRNRAYVGKLGTGRINALRSLQLGNRPMLSVDTLEILEDDNGNFLLDPGEFVRFGVLLSNRANARGAEGIQVSVTSDDPDITIEFDSLGYPDLEPGARFNNEDEPFTLQVNEDAIPHTTWITVNVSAEPGGFTLTRIFEVVIGHPPILLIDDDDGDEDLDMAQYYLSAIEAGGKGWVRWNVANNFSPDPVTLSEYDMVIWETGTSQPPLDELDRYQIEEALNIGARIMLVGPLVGDDPDNNELLRNYFGARHLQDGVSAYTVDGLSGGRPLPANVQMRLTGDGGANQDRYSPSTCTPVLGADTLATYHVGNRDYGVAGVYRNDEGRGSKTVYMGFAFEAVSNAGTPRSAVINLIYDWFMGIENSIPGEAVEVPQLMSLDEIYPNPFNSILRVNYQVPAGIGYELALYDQLGKRAGILAFGTGNTGSSSVAWDAGNLPTGAYILRLSVDGNQSFEKPITLIK